MLFQDKVATLKMRIVKQMIEMSQYEMKLVNELHDQS